MSRPLVAAILLACTFACFATLGRAPGAVVLRSEGEPKLEATSVPPRA